MITPRFQGGHEVTQPVAVAGAAIGDAHAQQGNGEIAVHTTDVSGEVELGVEVIRGLALDGPILLQRLDDLPALARPITPELRDKAKTLAQRYGSFELEDNGPVTFIGSGPTINDVTRNALDRATRVTFLCPMAVLERLGIAHLVRQQYGL